MDCHELLPFGSVGTDRRLSPGEARLVACAARGRRWLPGMDLTGIDLPAQALAFPWLSEIGAFSGPLSPCTIRAEVIYCLLTGARWSEDDKPWPLHGSGLTLSNAVVHGDLDLEGCEVLAPLTIRDSAIRGHVKLRDAHTRSLCFDGTHLHSISAQRAVIEGSLCIGRGFFALGGLDLRDGRIRNRLDARGGRFECWTAFMLAAERLFGCSLAAPCLSVGNDVMLGEGFHAAGSINLMQADIGGNLICTGGSFCPETGKALCARAAHIHGEVLLNDERFDWQHPMAFGSRAVIERHPCCFSSQVDLSEARIDHDLRCDGGVFHYPGAIALECTNIFIGGDVRLTDGCQIDGKADFTAAEIGRSLRCKRGRLRAPSDEALRLKGAQIRGGLYLSELQEFTGALNLRRASAGFVDIDETLLQPGGADQTENANAMVLDGFIYQRLAAEEAPLAALQTWLNNQTDENFVAVTHMQPWTHLALVLRAMGLDAKADAILATLSERRRLAG